MATYFHGNSEIQADGLQTLYLMNPGYVGYSDTPQPPANMVFLNSTGNPLNPGNLSQSQTQNQHFVGIPLQPTPPSGSTDPNRPSNHHPQQEISALHGFIPRVHYNLWSPMDQQMSSATTNNSIGVTDYASQLGLRRSMVPPSQQGLSLSLSPQQPAYGTYRTESDIPAPASAPMISPGSGEEMRVSGGSSSSASAVSNGTSSIQSVLLGSKYLKVAQQLLDEVVNVGNGIKTELSKGNNKGQINKMNRESSSMTGEGSSIGGESSVRRGTELTTAERQELQMKKAKLVSMLDEVEQRYRQYHHQMQIVVSSFEQAAGFGSAKTYTALALQTISKQFRCLKDAISAQIRATGKSLGEEDCLGGGKVEGSRLRFVDHQLRQQRALQQLGMIQHNAWRPQRGLPERSVSILRAWLFEHFLHPYPKDSDKIMLAKQTGLTRSQVSNWFINARVRLWKPMVEEMYMEEIKDQEQNGLEDKTSKSQLNEESGSKSTENSPNNTDQTKSLSSKQEKHTNPNVPPAAISNSTVPTSTMEDNIRAQAGFFLVGSSNTEGLIQANTKKSRNTELQHSQSSIQSMDMEMKPGEPNRELCMKFGNERQNRDGYSLLTDAANHHGGGFGAYHQMGEIGRFDPEQFAPRFSNGVSLTLGLPHCENLSLSGAQQTYLSNQNIQLGRRLEIGGNEPNDFCGLNTPPPSHSTTAYENLNMQNRKRFAAQLLPDFVA
ncbi:Homeobox domain [Macleaya cordata]|uniref:Homeobox domain n=1 Tax=Macleaya cordata TaxID=56857 RepID=A0A200Q9L4_MACCD|nr:Homeobox domain [Macleaya cordata]